MPRFHFKGCCLRGGLAGFGPGPLVSAARPGATASSAPSRAELALLGGSETAKFAPRDSWGSQFFERQQRLSWVARRVGKMAAKTATPKRISATATQVAGSRGLTPKSARRGAAAARPSGACPARRRRATARAPCRERCETESDESSRRQRHRKVWMAAAI